MACTIKGTVYDAVTKKVLVYANVYIPGIITDMKEGTYVAVTGSNPNNLTAMAGAPGHYPVLKNITPINGQTLTVDFYLKPKA